MQPFRWATRDLKLHIMMLVQLLWLITRLRHRVVKRHRQLDTRVHSHVEHFGRHRLSIIAGWGRTVWIKDRQRVFWPVRSKARLVKQRTGTAPQRHDIE